MEKASWTSRGKVQETDKAVIKAVVEKNPMASRIFLTGEVHERYIGDPAATLLCQINDVLGEPLFVQTRHDTIQMTRFEPKVVWRLFHPDLLQKLIKAEEDRLGVTPVRMDEFDFYESLIFSLTNTKEGGIFPKVAEYGDVDDFYQIMYLSCLILYGKPGYMAVPLSQHFAMPETADFIRALKLRELTFEEHREYVLIREKYKQIQGITNPELSFLVKLYDTDAKR